MTIERAVKAGVVSNNTAFEWFKKGRVLFSTTETLLPKMKGMHDEPI